MASPAGGVLAIAKPFSFGSVQHLFDPGTHSRGRFRLSRPDRFEDRKHVIGAYNVYWLGAKGRCIVLQRRFPLCLMLLIAKTLRKRLAHIVGHFAKRGDAAVPLAFFDGVDALGNRPTRSGGFLACVGERHTGGAAEPHFLRLTAPCEP